MDPASLPKRNIVFSSVHPFDAIATLHLIYTNLLRGKCDSWGTVFSEDASFLGWRQDLRNGLSPTTSKLPPGLECFNVILNQSSIVTFCLGDGDNETHLLVSVSRKFENWDKSGLLGDLVRNAQLNHGASFLDSLNAIATVLYGTYELDSLDKEELEKATFSMSLGNRSKADQLLKTVHDRFSRELAAKVERIESHASLRLSIPFGWAEQIETSDALMLSPYYFELVGSAHLTPTCRVVDKNIGDICYKLRILISSGFDGPSRSITWGRRVKSCGYRVIRGWMLGFMSTVGVYWILFGLSCLQLSDRLLPAAFIAGAIIGNFLLGKVKLTRLFTGGCVIRGRFFVTSDLIEPAFQFGVSEMRVADAVGFSQNVVSRLFDAAKVFRRDGSSFVALDFGQIRKVWPIPTRRHLRYAASDLIGALLFLVSAIALSIAGWTHSKKLIEEFLR